MNKRNERAELIAALRNQAKHEIGTQKLLMDAAALLEAQYEPAGERVGEPRYTHAQIVELCRDHPLHVADHIQWLYKKSGVSKQQLSAIVNAAGTYALTIRSLNTEHQARSQRAKFEAELSAILEVQRPALKPSVFLQNIHHAYAQLDGTYAWPNSREGDMLKQAKTEIEAAIAQAKGARK